ncbi:hypothetical protein [Thiorhodococcus minor]|uniref:Uncharacterized protein n=1 Tax=Thiorhodococcus minor TaxID=57489 RepID=A0A6M0JZW1_9GAMM|nr:hypothetical protein [Thiorhodococcus minor]NEV61615.1 hypothetical protein [Thiorhodococcus minor]
MIVLSLFVAGPVGLLLTALFFIFRNGEPVTSSSPIQIADESPQGQSKAFSYWRDDFDRDTEEYLLDRDNNDLLEIITRLPEEDDTHPSRS